VIPLAYFGFLVIACFLALQDWRRGLLLMVLAGVLQDPVRKLMEGTPAWMVLAFIPLWLVVCINLSKTGKWPWEPLFRAYPRLREVTAFLLGSLLLALLVLLMKQGVVAWKVGVIGLIGYLFPLLAIGVGFLYVRNRDDILRVMYFYCGITAVLLSGGLLEYWSLFPDWRAIGTEALGTTWVRHVPGYVVHLRSGFYRSPDMLGWHAALLVMFALVFALQERRPIWRAGWFALIGWGAVVLLISGRNKMIFMPLVFLATVASVYLYKGRTSKAIGATLAGVAAIALLLLLNQTLDVDDEYLMYTQVGGQTAVARLEGHGIGSVITTYRQSGFFGEGLGTASTGSRFGGQTARTWQESGTSKLMVELGVVGFSAALAFALTMLAVLLRLLRRIPQQAPGLLLFSGFVGVVLANGASFTVSHQAFGDPFLVTLAGFLLGVVFSAPRWVLEPEAG
jgi:hypothetical protein